MNIVNVIYHVKPGQREAFYQAICDAKIEDATRHEKGLIRYEFFSSLENSEDLLLWEVWENDEVQAHHKDTPHYAQLTELKKTYLNSAEIHLYHPAE